MQKTFIFKVAQVERQKKTPLESLYTTDKTRSAKVSMFCNNNNGKQSSERSSLRNRFIKYLLSVFPVFIITLYYFITQRVRSPHVKGVNENIYSFSFDRPSITHVQHTHIRGTQLNWQQQQTEPGELTVNKAIQ